MTDEHPDPSASAPEVRPRPGDIAIIKTVQSLASLHRGLSEVEQFYITVVVTTDDEGDVATVRDHFGRHFTIEAWPRHEETYIISGDSVHVAAALAASVQPSGSGDTPGEFRILPTLDAVRALLTPYRRVRALEPAPGPQHVSSDISPTGEPAVREYRLLQVCGVFPSLAAAMEAAGHPQRDEWTSAPHTADLILTSGASPNPADEVPWMIHASGAAKELASSDTDLTGGRASVADVLDPHDDDDPTA